METRELYYGAVPFSPKVNDKSVYDSNNNIVDLESLPVITDSETADLNLADENGYILARFRRGHFAVKKFDSETWEAQSKTNFEPDPFTPDAPYINAIKSADISGDAYLRIPFCEFTNNGVLIVGCDIRYGNAGADKTHISTGIVRSLDGGKTFSTPQIIIPHGNITDFDRRRDGTILVDRNTNRVFIIVQQITSDKEWTDIHTLQDFGQDTIIVYSDDDGATWSQPQSLIPKLTNPQRLNTDIITFFGGVGAGITMNNGTLVFPIQCGMVTSSTQKNTIQDGLLYSSDHGESWTLSKTLTPASTSECNVVEFEPGKLLLNLRSGIGKRRVFYTEDMGDTWIIHPSDQTLIEPTACQASLHKARIGYKSKCLFANPHAEDSRRMITVQESTDYINFHPVCLLSRELTKGYTCLCSFADQVIAVYETGQMREIRVCDITKYIWA